MPKLIRHIGYGVLTTGLALVAAKAHAAPDPCATVFSELVQSELSLTSAQEDLVSTCRYQNAGDQLTPYQALAQTTLAISIANQQFRNVKNRLILLRRGLGSGIDVNGLNQQSTDSLLPASLSGFSRQSNGGGASGDKDSPFDRLGIFVNGNFGVGDKDGTDRELGFEYDSQGVTAGIDYRFTDNFVLGGTFGYNAIKSDFDASRGNLNLDGYSFSLYSTYYNDDFYLDTIFSGGWNEYDTRRNIQLPGFNQTALGNTRGNDYSFNVTGGYDFHQQGLTYGPYGRVSYQNVQIDGYQENTSNPGSTGFGAVTSIGKQNAVSLQTALGGQLSYAISTSFGVLMPTARAEWVHEFHDGSRPVNWSFANIPTQTAFVNLSDGADRNFGNLGAGLSATFTHGASAFLFYETMVGRDHISEHSINAGVRAEF
ncbi:MULTISPECIES: autotransporter outer membrane beta-barrel domain-containing protein [Methylomicrobium]|uniref:Outer membrane autotransporter barrel domain-containing protein n=1 Tax=Methylomicrobium album BG8 TaxID=686340 RepID=H8GNN2_METAL|nr:MULTISPECIES: autotransporter outer membrane beta-barrel domain-containing protein [Methylomicrobium]EIC30788.1 outer membrane autotransporter barrel domain-containing protein [Methylomicrobium album BG8]